MFSTVLSAALQGLQVEFIDVEADLSNGLPMFHMVGYLSSEVKEAGRTGTNGNSQFGACDSGEEDCCESFTGRCQKERDSI